jgi:hypothetical protein
MDLKHKIVEAANGRGFNDGFESKKSFNIIICDLYKIMD